MISLLRDENALKSGVDSPLYARVYTAFFNKKSEFDGVYIQTEKAGNITALFSVLRGRCTLITLENADLDEIKSFFSFNEISSVTTLDKGAAEALFENVRTHNVLKLVNLNCDTHFSQRVLKEDGEALYRSLYSCLFEGSNASFEVFYCDFCPGINTGLCEGVYVKSDDNVVSCALAPNVSQNSAIISGVATLVKYRKQGLGGDCVKGLCRCLLNRGVKDIFLWCENNNVSFYENLGFKKITNIYVGR